MTQREKEASLPSSNKDDSPPERVSIRYEFPRWWRLAWPTALQYMCTIAQNVTALSVLGHYGTDYLAAASLAIVWTTITSVPLPWGFAAALSPLCSQAYGAKNYRLVGTWLQIGVICSSVLCLPVAGLWLVTTPVLKFVHIDAHIAELAGTFARYSLLWLWPQAMLFAGSNFLQSINIVLPQLVVAIFFVIFNLGANILLVHGVYWGSWQWEGLGFVGSPIATALSKIGYFLTLWAYAHFKRIYQECWQGWSRDCSNGKRIMTYLGQAAPLALSICLEEWQLQVVVVFSGRLGAVDVATMSALLEIFYFLSTANWGIANATATRIGYYLGDGHIQGAKTVIKVAAVGSFTVSALVSVIIVVFRHEIAHIFSSDPDVWAASAQIFPVLSAAYTCLAIFMVAMSTLEGQARPGMSALAFVIGAWGISVPFSYLFAFTWHYGLIGLWYGLIAGYSVVSLIAVLGVVFSNWEQLVIAARTRSEADTKSDKQSTSPIAVDTTPLLYDNRGGALDAHVVPASAILSIQDSNETT